MADNITKTENKYMCKRECCTASFKHKTQLQRHKHNKCKGVSPKKQKKFSQLQDGSYQCFKCRKTYPYRMSIHRHVKIGKCLEKYKENHQCVYCNKVFEYKSLLVRLMLTRKI